MCNIYFTPTYIGHLSILTELSQRGILEVIGNTSNPVSCKLPKDWGKPNPPNVDTLIGILYPIKNRINYVLIEVIKGGVSRTSVRYELSFSWSYAPGIPVILPEHVLVHVLSFNLNISSAKKITNVSCIEVMVENCAYLSIVF